MERVLPTVSRETSLHKLEVLTQYKYSNTARFLLPHVQRSQNWTNFEGFASFCLKPSKGSAILGFILIGLNGFSEFLCHPTVGSHIVDPTGTTAGRKYTVQICSKIEKSNFKSH